MKKIGITIIILVCIGLGYWYRGQLLAFFHYRIPVVAQQFSQNPIVEDLKQEIFTPPPLKSSDNYQNGQLTMVGVVNWTNTQRQQNGNLPPLVENGKLDDAAQIKLADMFKQQYFEHISPQGKGPSDLADEVGYSFIAIGENLALGNFQNDQALVQAWMNSPGHRANILNTKYQEIGVAVGKGQFQGKTVWLAVQEFGKPASSCPSVDKSLKSQIDSYKSDLAQLEPQLQQMESDLKNSNPQTPQQVSSYNQEVSQYNNLVKEYNNRLDIVKSLVDQYNSQVKAYNACLGQ